jgi:hypothetical protein
MKHLFKVYWALCVSLFFQGGAVFAQAFPSEDENIPFLITFGKEGLTSWGDDDHSQTFFINIPKDSKLPFYVRVFDPECGGKHDEPKGGYDTQTKFSIYGGKLAYTSKDAIGHNPEGNYDSGNLIDSKVFGVNEKYDNQWYSFGPFNPSEGEWVEKFNGYIFKVICDGISGDDGNLYRYFISTKPDQNVKVEGANGFTYEYTFRLPNTPSVCHIYPYIDALTISVQQYNFDWDGDGVIRIVSVARKGEIAAQSPDDNWRSSKHIIDEREKNTSMDIQFIKSAPMQNNNVVVRVTNQYGEMLPFFSIPIGGKPVYKPQIKITPIR